MRAPLLLGGAAAVLLIAGLATVLRRDPDGGPASPDGAAAAPGPVALALSRAAQKRTLSDMRAVGLAYLAWLAEAGPASAATPPPGSPAAGEGRFDFAALPAGGAAEIAARLVPRYLVLVPERDGWGHPYDYREAGSSRAPGRLAIRSPGADGAFSTDRYAPGTFPPDELHQDLVWVDGVFVRAPASSGEGRR